jgi:hypothetical protein
MRSLGLWLVEVIGLRGFYILGIGFTPCLVFGLGGLGVGGVLLACGGLLGLVRLGIHLLPPFVLGALFGIEAFGVAVPPALVLCKAACFLLVVPAKRWGLHFLFGWLLGQDSLRQTMVAWDMLVDRIV